MIKYTAYISFILLICILASCKLAIKPGELYGKWKYIKVEHPNADPPQIPTDQLQSQSPSIEFLKNNQFVIIWGGKVLSHGKFSTADRNINITEDLPDGSTRVFQFWVSELTDKEIVFATLGQDGSKVTAVKE